jgi:hypothetical protein
MLVDQSVPGTLLSQALEAGRSTGSREQRIALQPSSSSAREQGRSREPRCSTVPSYPWKFG